MRASFRTLDRITTCTLAIAFVCLPLFGTSVAAAPYTTKNELAVARDTSLEDRQDAGGRPTRWIATAGPRRLSTLVGGDESAWASVRAVHVRSYRKSHKRGAAPVSLRSTSIQDKASSNRPVEVAGAK